MSGNKANKACKWSIPVVNHTWLEDCFIQWKSLTVGHEKYIVFPPGHDFSDSLGERGIQRELILESLLALVLEMALAKKTAATPVTEVSNDDAGKQPPAHANILGTQKANEAEDATCRLDLEDQLNVGSKSQPTEVRRRGNDHIQMDEPDAVVSYELVQQREPKRTSPRRGGASHSPLRQATSPLQHAHKRLSSSGKRRHRADSETTGGDEPSPKKKSTRARLGTAGSLINNPSKTPSKFTLGPLLLRMDSVLMPPIGTDGAVAKSSQRSAKTSPVKDMHHPHARSVSPTFPLSSLKVDLTMDQEEGPSEQVSRCSAASRAPQHLREDIMPDVVNFEEMQRDNVRVANVPESGGGKEKADTGSNPVAKGKNASVQNDVEGILFSDEHENKKRRVTGTNDRSAGRCDGGDGRSDRAGASSQPTAEIPLSKGAEKNRAPPGDITRQAEQVVCDFSSMLI